MMIDIAVFLLMGVIVTFGGASRMDVFNPTIARLAAIPLLLGGLYWLGRRAAAPALVFPLSLLLAIAALPLIQLIPLPPSLWLRLPGHAFLAADYKTIGLSLPWLPISLTPNATANAALALLPPAGVFLVVAQSNVAQRRNLLVAVVILALANVLLGALQVAGGPESRLRFYAISNKMEAIGVFANRDHLASLLVVALPIVVWWMVDRQPNSALPRPAAVALGLSAIFVLLVGMGFTKSRAAVVLGVVALSLSLAMVAVSRNWWRARPDDETPRERKTFYRSLWAIGAVVGVIMVFTAISLGGALDRFGGEGLTDRWAKTPLFGHIGAVYFPFGSGLGSFDPVYRMFEPRALIDYAYLNHAHDEYAEIWVTAGLAGVALLIVAIGWVGWRTVEAWLSRAPMRDGAVAQARAGSIVVVLFLLHSVGDYPLRTSTLACVMALACALLVPPPNDPTPPAGASRSENDLPIARRHKTKRHSLSRSLR